MAESADALASGASGGNPVKVQILSPAPFKCYRLTETSSAYFVFLDFETGLLFSGPGFFASSILRHSPAVSLDFPCSACKILAKFCVRLCGKAPDD